MRLCGSSIAPHAVGREWLSVRDTTGHPVSYEARATHCKRGFGKEATMGVLKNNDDLRAGLPHLKTNIQTTTTTKMNMVPHTPFSVFTSPCVIWKQDRSIRLVRGSILSGLPETSHQTLFILCSTWSGPGSWLLWESPQFAPSRGRDPARECCA